YVRRVYITDDAELLPPYLRFVRGVVDSEDLPLNLSREMLQNNPQVRQIRNGLVGRVLSELESTATKDADGFAKIWETFGSILKEGLYEDQERQAQLLGLARFASTAGDKPRSIKEYVADLKPNQTEIYYLVGDSLERLKSNPKLEAAKARGVEVLLLTEPVDAFWSAAPLEFEGKPLKSLSQGEVDFSPVPLTDQEAKPDEAEKATVDDATCVGGVMWARGGRVPDARASKRLPDGAGFWGGGERGPDRGRERPPARHNRSPGTKPILELNMRHILVR